MKNKKESGLVSLVVCMIIMVIIALITISFATLARREQRQALDSQLSKQAFYAAETGINDALARIYDTTSPLTENITSCDDVEQDKISTVRTLDTNISYTCVFVDQTPTQIVANVKTDASSVYRIATTGGLSKLTFTWQNDQINVPQIFTNHAPPDFPSYDNWNGAETPGVLRIELVPVVNSRALSANTIDVFGYPTNLNTRSSHAAIADAAKNGEILTGGCQSSGANANKCTVSIDLDGSATGGDYYLRMISIYDPTSVVVEAFDGAGANLKFRGAQAAIDSTGKSSDVLRRIKVYKSLIPDKSVIPDYTLSVGDDLCKRLETNNTSTTTDQPLPGNPLCDPSGL